METLLSSTVLSAAQAPAAGSGHDTGSPGRAEPPPQLLPRDSHRVFQGPAVSIKNFPCVSNSEVLPRLSSRGQVHAGGGHRYPKNPAWDFRAGAVCSLVPIGSPSAALPRCSLQLLVLKTRPASGLPPDRWSSFLRP